MSAPAAGSGDAAGPRTALHLAPARLGGWPLGLAAFCAVFALRMSADPSSGGAPRSVEAYAQALVYVLWIFATPCLAVLVAARVAPRRPAGRAATLAVAVVAGVALGYGLALGPAALLALWRDDAFALVAEPVQFVGIGLLGLALFLVDERDAALRRRLLEEQRQQAEIARAATEARLSVLRAQVEPHFLFNTLAHLRRLYSTEPRAAPVMLQELVRYLGDAQPALQRGAIPLVEDARLALAYLNLQKVRMAERLRFAIDLEPGTQRVHVPPLALTTLVENAIEHGLATLPAGGEIRVRATACDAAIRIEVADTGRGLTGHVGTGVGLANLRARLAWLHGPRAALELRANAPTGVTATIVLPREPGRGPA